MRKPITEAYPNFQTSRRSCEQPSEVKGGDDQGTPQEKTEETANKAVLNPSADFEAGITYKAVVTTGAKDLAGNALDQDPTPTGAQPKAWFFTISS